MTKRRPMTEENKLEALELAYRIDAAPLTPWTKEIATDALLDVLDHPGNGSRTFDDLRSAILSILTITAKGAAQ